MDFSPIVKQLVTINDANDLLNDLSVLSESIYLTKNNFNSKVKTINIRYYSTMVNLLDKHDKKEVIRELIETIKKIPIINVNLSFEPSFKLTEKISSWLEDQIGKKILIAINYYPELFTNVEFEYQGQYGKF